MGTASIVEGICYHQYWGCDLTAAIPRPKATAGLKAYWSQLLLTRMCTLSFLCLEEDRMHSSGWYGQREWSLFRQGHGAGRNAKAVGPGEQSKSPSRIYWSAGRSRIGNILPDPILPVENEGTRLILFLVNIYTKKQLFYNSVIKHFLG